MEKFVIAKDFVRKVRRFNLTGRTLEFKIKPIPSGSEPVSWIRDAINQVITKGIEGLHPEDQVAFSFCCKQFSRGEGWLKFRAARDVTYDDVWKVISDIYQSNSSGLNTETFCLGVTSVKMPAGRGRGRNYNSYNEECAKRKGIISINNKDNMCLPRALVVAIAFATKDPEMVKIRKDTGKIQRDKAIELTKNAAVTIPTAGCGIPELQQFQRHLTGFKIVVYKYGTKGRDVIFKGTEEEEAPSLNLLYHEGHYNVVTSLTSAFLCRYYCETCHIPYDHKERHRCGGMCPCCQHSPACSRAVLVTCDNCKRSFRGQTCYNNHLQSLCQKIRRCEECFKVVQSDRKHTCGEIYCKICRKHAPADHLCYMQPDAGKPKTEDLLFCFYDLETRQEKQLEAGARLHEPNLCVFKQCCDTCLNTSAEICKKCGVRLHVLRCNDPISRFMEFILGQRKIFKQVVVVAHNGQAFDHQFVLNYILTATDLKPDLIMRGTKIIMMSLGNVKFLDSLNYFPLSLSKLPRAFGLGAGFKKGYFPYLFNTTANTNYVGPLPPVEYYDPDNMKEDDRIKFLEWYEQNKTDTFDMQKDLVAYCISDVEILTAACLKFRQQMIETGNVCPFTEACTIASTCNKVYRRNFLQPNTIGIIPKGGYRWRDNQSKVAIQWLVWMEKEQNINIVCAAKQQEARVAGVKVDGYCAETNQVFEFHGCYYHGCPACFKNSRDEPLRDDPTQTLNTRYEATVAKTERLRDLGHHLIQIWECEFRRQLQQNAEICSYVENHPLLVNTPLNPRDAFFGGRTGNTYEYYKCKDGEKIKYVDVCSLYPWVCKYGKFPIGHPKVYVGEECPPTINNVEGLIKCKILPPQNLYHPILPTKMNNKLMFVLCRTCGEKMNQGKCHHHTEEERALTGTWVIDEVKKALEMGYRMLKVHEVWSYEIDQFDKATKKGGLFTSMMNKFVAVKQQASGWPQHCRTDEEKNRYIEEFLEREDVKLEFAEIVENPGLRSLAKLILNSFWGKLGQRENQPKTAIVRTPAEFFNMLSNPAICVTAALPVNEDVLIVNYEHRDESYDPLTTVNVTIAAYVTTQARLKLYSYLEKLGDRVLYYDTDSVIYVSREGEWDVPTGSCLGEMTDELEGYGAGSHIKEFVSGGPKNYAYKFFAAKDNEEKVTCKVKGISLNYAASQLVNFDTIKEMILSPTEPVYITGKNIRRTKEHEVVTREETKIYKPLSTKRCFLDDHSSYPYGHKRCRTE
ncbi:hypothetical protein NQ315_008296 [Exocentrus adspersus]|uniref:DNA-directed DNA polymerase n=1 Tax=Exocentrus adspersus TaxID=1586481 RepID=A0AAV8VM36_9CUCU|nr:hypothetical protein NQ315_008296 [Exocentrus adspersus]